MKGVVVRKIANEFVVETLAILFSLTFHQFQ